MLSRGINRQQGHLFCWVPVVMAVGIGIYFWLPVEPPLWAITCLGTLAVGGWTLGARAAPVPAFFLMAAALTALGLTAAGVRTQLVQAPMLEFRYYGPVQGRLIAMDRSISDKPRLLMDRVILSKVDPDATPERVRVTLHGDRSLDTDLEMGKTVMLTAHLSPPRGPVEPGGFDFRRHAFFQGIGAVGYTRTPVMAIASTEPGAWVALQRFRYALSDRIRSALPDQRGAFAAAVLTGDRSALSRETVDAMRATNLAHLLAISGLHMGLLTAVVFGMLRGGLAMVPPLALRIDGKKWAACGALMAATAYLAMSGGNVSTQRAYVMVAVMLCAILLDRRALTLRAVAVAACLILLFRPEALLGPGFQMSFAATACLVWVFAWMRDNGAHNLPLELPGWQRRWLRALLALVVSSAVAGIATAPIGMAHFNMSATYGFPANLLAVPLMGSIVMPAAVLAAFLSVFGFAEIGLWVMGLGISAILWIADTISVWPAAIRPIRTPPGFVLPLFAFAALWGMLWQGRARFAGVAVMAACIWVWATVPRPDILIADSGKLIGAMTDQGRALSKKRGEGFAARSWLENDGDFSLREDASARWPADGTVLDLGVLALFPGEKPGLYECKGAVDICSSFEEPKLRETGAIALRLFADGSVQMRSVRDQTGLRPWSPTAWFETREIDTRQAELQ